MLLLITGMSTVLMDFLGAISREKPTNERGRGDLGILLIIVVAAFLYGAWHTRHLAEWLISFVREVLF
jgi:hypothetical protein